MNLFHIPVLGDGLMPELQLVQDLVEINSAQAYLHL